MLLDLVSLSYKNLKRWPVLSVCLAVLVVLSTLGGLMLLNALQTMRTFGIDPAGAAAETSGLIHLGRSWRGSGHEAISDSRISTLLEMLQRFGCQVSPVFIYGEGAEKRVSIGESDYYARQGFIGVSSDYVEIARSSLLELVEGRFFDAAEVDSLARVAVVGSSIASLVHESVGLHLPAPIYIDGIEYEVVGVVAAVQDSRSRLRDLSLDEAIILPYTTLVQDMPTTADYRLDLYAIAYRRSKSVTAEFVDRVINDWLRQAGLIGGRYVTRFYSEPLDSAVEHPSSLGLIGSIALFAWIAVFAALPAAAFGYLSSSRRVGVLRVMSQVGATPLHLAAQVAMENFAVTFAGAIAGLALSCLFVQPSVESLRLALAIGSNWFVFGCVGGIYLLERSCH